MHLENIDFVIVGAAKSATTWLQRQLQADSAIYMPDPELHFFSREFERGFDWYRAQFTPPASAKIVGEKSNSYMDVPEAAVRLHSALPHVRLFVVLRDPVERAYSDYCMLYRRGEVSDRIEEYLDPRKAAEGRFLYASQYDAHLTRLTDLFGRDAIHVTHYERVVRDPQAVLDGVRTHLGLELKPLGQKGLKREKDRNTALVPSRLRRRLAPIKPFVAPFRHKWAFRVARSLIARPPKYPELPQEIAIRLEEHFFPVRDSLRRMGYPFPYTA